MITIPESESIPEWFHFWLESESNDSFFDWNRNQAFQVSLELELE